MKRGWTAFLTVVCAVALVTAFGCKKEGPDKQPEAKQEAPAGKAGEKPATIEKGTPEGQPGEGVVKSAPKDPLAEMFPDSVSALLDVPAIKFLPADTYVVGVVANPLDILMRAGWVKLTKKYGDIYEKGVAEVTQEIGYNLLSPEGLKEIGIATDKPMGFAWFSGKDESLALFGTLTNADKFKTAVYSIAGRAHEKLEPRMLGDALVLAPRNDTEGCLILRGDTVIFSFSDRGDEKGLELATRISTMNEKDSLANDESFKKFATDLKFGKDAAAYVNFTAIMKEVTGMMTDRKSASENYAAKEVARLKAEKADPATIKEWEQRAKEEEDWQKKYEKRRIAEQEMFAMLLDPMSTMALGAELGDTALKMKAYTALKPDSLYRRLSRNGEGSSPLAKALNGRPMYFAHAWLDVPAYMEVIEKVVATEGVTLEEAYTIAKAAAGIDVKADVIPLLSGEFGFAVTANLDAPMEEPEMFFKEVGGAVMLGVTDMEKTQTLLGRLSDLAFVAPLVKSNKELGGYTITIPEWREVYVVVEGGYLVASTDASLFARLKEGKDGDFIANANPALRTILLTEDNAAYWSMDMALFGMFFMGMSMKDWEGAEQAAAEEDIPFSEDYKKMKAEMKAAKAEAKKMRKEMKEKEHKLIMSIVSRIGATAAVGKFTEAGMVAYGGQFINDESLEAFIEHMVDDGMGMYELEQVERKKIWKLEDKRWELDRKLQEQRAKDIQLHYEKKAKEQLDVAAAGAVKIVEEPVPAGVVEPLK